MFVIPKCVTNIYSFLFLFCLGIMCSHNILQHFGQEMTALRLISELNLPYS